MNTQTRLVNFDGMLAMLGGLTFEEFEVVQPYFVHLGFPRPATPDDCYDSDAIETWCKGYKERLNKYGSEIEGLRAARMPSRPLSQEALERLRQTPEQPWGKATVVQSHPGFVYFVGFEAYVKIGYTKNLTSRLASLQTGAPKPLTTYFVLPGSVFDEVALHQRFAEHRLHGEWFEFTDDIKEWIATHGRGG